VHPIALTLSLLALPLDARAGTIALWRFDEPAGRRETPLLRDSGPHGHVLELGPGALLGPGRFGHALCPTGAAGPGFVARSRRDRAAASDRRATFANVTDSKLNLGAGDWTLDGWFFLESDAPGEGVIFEIGATPRGTGDLITRLSVLPREQSFVLAGLAPVSDGPGASLAPRVEFANPEGPPGGVAQRFSATLLSRRPLPRGVWFHAAIVHREGSLHLWVDGRHCATTGVELLPLPRSDDGYVSLGGDDLGQHAFPGRIDELRVCDHALTPEEMADRQRPPAEAEP
jgi:hypothetical protein